MTFCSFYNLHISNNPFYDDSAISSTILANVVSVDGVVSAGLTLTSMQRKFSIPNFTLTITSSALNLKNEVEEYQ